MPYSSVSELPQAVKDKIKSPKKRRQWMHVWNSEYDKHHDESRAFASAWSVVRKFHVGVAEMDENLSFFLPIEKIDKQARTISGYASTDCRDSEGEVVSQEAIKAALPDYMAWANIREMHRPSAVGVAQEANHDGRGLYLTAKVVDDAAWNKVIEGVYKGFSIGGRKLAKVGNIITKLAMNEISIVDRPSNPDCMFTVAKMQGGTLVEDDAFLIKAADVEPDADDDEKAQADKKAKKKAKKLAKAAQSTGSASPSSVARSAEGRVEAASGEGKLRQLTFEKAADIRDLSLADSLSLRGDGIELNLKPTTLRKRRKDKVMSEESSGNSSAVQTALLKAMGYRPETATHPALPILKAAERGINAVRDFRKEATTNVERLFNLYKSGLAKADGTPGTAVNNADVMSLIKTIYDNLNGMKKSAKAARDDLRKAAGRISNPGTVEDGVSGVYEVPSGVTLKSPGDLDNAPAYKGDFVSKEHADALAKLAGLEAENRMLKAQPADPVHGRRPAGFDPNRLGVQSNKDSDAIMKGVDVNGLNSKDQRTVERELGKMIGNMVLTPGVGKTIFDPNFRGTMGGATP